MKKIVGILSLAVVLLTLYACQISVAPSQSPTDTPPQVTQPDQYQYSTFMQNIKVYNVEGGAAHHGVESHRCAGIRPDRRGSGRDVLDCAAGI